MGEHGGLRERRMRAGRPWQGNSFACALRWLNVNAMAWRHGPISILQGLGGVPLLYFSFCGSGLDSAIVLMMRGGRLVYCCCLASS